MTPASSLTASATSPGRSALLRHEPAVQPVAGRRAESDRHVAAVERAEHDGGRAERLDDPALDAVGGNRGRGDEERPADGEQCDESPHARILAGRG